MEGQVTMFAGRIGWPRTETDAGRRSAPSRRRRYADPAAGGVRRAMSLSMRGRYAEAVECYRRALSREPDSATVQYLLGLALMGLNRRQEARAAWQAALGSGETGSEAEWIRRRARGLLEQYPA